MGTTTTVGNGDVDFYFTGVNLAYLPSLKGNNKALYSKIAYVPPAGAVNSSRAPVTLDDGRTISGTKVKFPISLAASAPEVWPYGTARKVEPYSQIEIEMFLNRYAPPAKEEYFDVLNNDIFGIIKGQLPQMMDRSQILWDRVIATRLVENANWDPDGIPFFTPLATPHQANPFKAGVGTFYTDYAITGIDQPNMRFLLSELENRPGPDGLPLDTDNVEIMVVAPNADMEVQLLQIFQGAISAEPVGTNAAAGVSNPLQGRAKVQLFKQLARTKNAPIWAPTGNAQDRSKVGYMFALPNGEGRPIALVPQRQPTAFYTGQNGSDHLRVTRGAIQYGWDAFGEAKLVLPQRALRFIVNPV